MASRPCQREGRQVGRTGEKRLGVSCLCFGVSQKFLGIPWSEEAVVENERSGTRKREARFGGMGNKAYICDGKPNTYNTTMTKKEATQLFEAQKVRTVWDDEAEKWYVSIVDVITVLANSKDATAYWRKLRQRLKAVGNETVTNCHALKLRAADGKMCLRCVSSYL